MDRAPIDLTDEERAIVALLAQGHTANRIAATTELGPRSVVAPDSGLPAKTGCEKQR